MTCNLKPLADNLIIEPIDVPLSTRIVIPDKAKQPPTRGRVIACGPCRVTETGQRVPMTVRVGDEVLFHKHGVETVSDEAGTEWLLAREVDVLAVVG